MAPRLAVQVKRYTRQPNEALEGDAAKSAAAPQLEAFSRWAKLQR